MSSKKTPKPATVVKVDGPQIIVCFGPPACGVTTVLEVLTGASETPMTKIDYDGEYTIDLLTELLYDSGLKFILVDVEGGLLSKDDVVKLSDIGLLVPKHGAVVRFYADVEECLARAPEDYIDAEGLEAWDLSILDVEETIRERGLSYFMIPNHDLEEAVTSLAIRLALKS